MDDAQPNISTGDARPDPADAQTAADGPGPNTADGPGKLTGWTQTIEVICHGDGASEIERVTSGAAALDGLLDHIRAHPNVRLVKTGDPKFGTRDLKAGQP